MLIALWQWFTDRKGRRSTAVNSIPFPFPSHYTTTRLTSTPLHTRAYVHAPIMIPVIKGSWFYCPITIVSITCKFFCCPCWFSLTERVVLFFRVMRPEHTDEFVFERVSSGAGMRWNRCWGRNCRHGCYSGGIRSYVPEIMSGNNVVQVLR